MRSIIILVVLLLIGTAFAAGTWSFFNDNEASNADQMVSGTLDLKTDGGDGTTKTIDEKNLAVSPGESSGLSIVELGNSGTVGGSSLDIAISYVESDGTPNAVDMTANETAAVFEVIVLNYDVTDLLPSVSDNNSNGYIDVQDVSVADLSGQSGIAAGVTKDFSIELTSSNTTSTDYANDGIDITMAFTLNQ